MVFICVQCKFDKCHLCVNKTCNCKCNSGEDIDEGVLATIAGAGMAFGGLALTMFSGGLAIPIGGALMGAGISSIHQGIGKSVKKEKIDGEEYFGDVAFGALVCSMPALEHSEKQSLKRLLNKESKKWLLKKIVKTIIPTLDSTISQYDDITNKSANKRVSGRRH